VGWNHKYVFTYIYILNLKQMKTYSNLNFLHLWTKMHPASTISYHKINFKTKVQYKFKQNEVTIFKKIFHSKFKNS
jgi:hypothetical protein